MKASALFIRRARRGLAKRYGGIMEIMLGPRWDLEWLDEGACIVDDLADAAGRCAGSSWSRSSIPAR